MDVLVQSVPGDCVEGCNKECMKWSVRGDCVEDLPNFSHSDTCSLFTYYSCSFSTNCMRFNLINVNFIPTFTI